MTENTILQRPFLSVELFSKIIPKNEHVCLRIMLFVMGSLIVLFNVLGYEVLFKAEPLIYFLPISPFGILLGCAEFAVLLWTSAVIKEWSVSSRILKLSMFILVPAFWFLCYAGVNSYLDSLASAEITTVIPHLIFDLKNLTAIGHSDLLLLFAGRSLCVTSTTLVWSLHFAKNSALLA